MIAISIIEKLENSNAPFNLEKEIEIARKQGFCAEYISSLSITAESKLASLRVPSTSDFFKIHSKYRYFPNGSGEELHSLDEIIGEKESEFHDDEAPGIYEKFLQLTSIEGEGSYFYEISTEKVFDVNWGEEQDLVSGQLKCKWASYSEFLSWYYLGG